MNKIIKMKKLITLLICTTFLMLSACSKEEYEKYEEPEYLTTYAYVYASGATEYIYDGDTVIEEIDYDTNKNITSKTKYTYDNGILIGETTYDSLGNMKSIKLFVYDENNNIVNEGYYDESGKIKNSTSYTYDENNLINKLFLKYDQNTNIESLTDYTYDSNRNEIEYMHYTSNGEFEHNISTYNDEGNKIEKVSYDINEKIESKIEYEYDDKGNEIERISYNSNGSITKHISEYTYNSKGNLTKEINYDYENDTLTNTSSFDHQYDKYNREVLVIGYKNDEENYKAETIYDDKNKTKSYTSSSKIGDEFIIFIESHQIEKQSATENKK